MRSDAEILKRVRNGRVGDFRLLVDRYQGAVFALAYRMLGRREDAEDVVQETFLRAFRSLSSHEPDRGFWPWARRIAINCCLGNDQREVPSQKIDELVENGQPLEDSIQAEAFRACERRLVLEAVDALPAPYRTVIILRYLEEMTTNEMSEVLMEPAGTVRVRLHRALRMLSDRLAVVRDEL